MAFCTSHHREITFGSRQQFYLYSLRSQATKKEQGLSFTAPVATFEINVKDTQEAANLFEELTWV